MKIVLGTTLLLAAVGAADAQTKPTAPAAASAPSMSSSATTLAPVKAGSTQMHEVPTPSVDKRSTSIGTEQKLTGKGGN